MPLPTVSGPFDSVQQIIDAFDRAYGAAKGSVCSENGYTADEAGKKACAGAILAGSSEKCRAIASYLGSGGEAARLQELAGSLMAISTAPVGRTLVSDFLKKVGTDQQFRLYVIMSVFMSITTARARFQIADTFTSEHIVAARHLLADIGVKVTIRGVMVDFSAVLANPVVYRAAARRADFPDIVRAWRKGGEHLEDLKKRLGVPTLAELASVEARNAMRNPWLTKDKVKSMIKRLGYVDLPDEEDYDKALVSLVEAKVFTKRQSIVETVRKQNEKLKQAIPATRNVQSAPVQRRTPTYTVRGELSIFTMDLNGDITRSRDSHDDNMMMGSAFPIRTTRGSYRTLVMTLVDEIGVDKCLELLNNGEFFVVKKRGAIVHPTVVVSGYADVTFQ